MAGRKVHSWFVLAAFLGTGVSGRLWPEGPAEGRAPAAGVVEEARGQFIDPFLEDVTGKLGDPAAAETLRTPLRALSGRVEGWLSSRLKDVKERREAMAAVREALVKALAGELVRSTESRAGGTGAAEGPGAAARARKLVDEARVAEHLRRADQLHESIMCWCPKEEWTKTLAGCPDGCAYEQKELVRAWLDEGLSDAEILARMEAHEKGGPRVLAVPPPEGTNLLGYVFPFAVFAAAAALVVVLLRRVVRPAAPGGERREPEETPEETKWGEEIERELKEMEN